MRKIDKVPMTVIMFAWNGLRSHPRSPSISGVKVIHRITSRPIVAPTAAPALLARRLMKPSRNSPSMPPANTPLIFHHASRMLCTPIIASATPVPMKAGDLLIFSYLTIHGSTPNTSDTWRRMLLFEFRSPLDSRKSDPESSVGQGLIVRGVHPNPAPKEGESY